MMTSSQNLYRHNFTILKPDFLDSSFFDFSARSFELYLRKNLSHEK